MRILGSIEAWLCRGGNQHPVFRRQKSKMGTHDMRHGMLIKLLTHPKLTLIPQSLAAPTILSLSSLSAVSKLRTAPAPEARRSWMALPGCPASPG